MRHRERPGKKAFYASAGVHVLAVLAAFLAQVSDPDFTDFETIQITLVSPPPVQEAPEPEPVVEEEEEPEEAPPEPTPTPTEPEEDPGDPEPSEELSGEDLNIRMEGLVRDFPEYYANIQRQIQRCFEYRGGGRLETSIVFYISRDGSVDGGTIDFYERSGNVNFDYAAMGAVECAGGRFGPLPEEMGRDRLPILFTFRPRG